MSRWGHGRYENEFHSTGKENYVIDQYMIHVKYDHIWRHCVGVHACVDVHACVYVHVCVCTLQSQQNLTCLGQSKIF